MNTKTGVYAIIDAATNEIAGSQKFLHIHRHVASAIRMFRDVANAEGTLISSHLGDFALVSLGTYNEEDHSIEPKFEIVMQGSVILAERQQAGQQLHLEKP